MVTTFISKLLYSFNSLRDSICINYGSKSVCISVLQSSFLLGAQISIIRQYNVIVNFVECVYNRSKHALLDEISLHTIGAVKYDRNSACFWQCLHHIYHEIRSLKVTKYFILYQISLYLDKLNVIYCLQMSNYVGGIN